MGIYQTQAIIKGPGRFGGVTDIFVFPQKLLIGYFRLIKGKLLPRRVRKLAPQGQSPQQGLEIGETRHATKPTRSSFSKNRTTQSAVRNISFWYRKTDNRVDRYPTYILYGYLKEKRNLQDKQDSLYTKECVDLKSKTVSSFVASIH